MPSFIDALLGKPRTLRRSRPAPAPDARVFTIDTENSIEVQGYTPDEARELMAAYREHVRLMGDMAHEFAGRADAVRYTPQEA